jgi:hypothetical protein
MPWVNQTPFSEAGSGAGWASGGSFSISEGFSMRGRIARERFRVEGDPVPASDPDRVTVILVKVDGTVDIVTRD